MQITLPANFFTSTISSIIVVSRIVQQIKTQQWEYAIHSRFSKGAMPFGAGYKETFEMDLNTVIDRPVSQNGNINPYSYENKKSFKEGVLFVDQEKLTMVTYDVMPTVNQSFENDSLVQEYLALTLSSNNRTIEEYFAEIALAEWNASIASTSLQSTQTITVDLYDVAQITDASTKRDAEQQNSIIIRKAIDIILTDITVKSTKYTNDNTIYTKFAPDDTYAIFNKKWLREIAAGSVNMYNEEAINYMLPKLDRLEIPDAKVTDPNLIMTLQTSERFAIIDGYRMGFPLLNQVTGSQTNFDHFQYGIGHFEQAPFVKIMANPTITYSTGV